MHFITDEMRRDADAPQRRQIFYFLPTKNVSPLILLRITQMDEILLTIHNYVYANE